MEFKIENTRVYGIEKAIVASGNSYRTEIRDCEPNEKDYKRGATLGSCLPGSGHDTFLNACLVTMDITAPLYWWKEAQRYHWIEFISSQSTMHCVLKFNISGRCTSDTKPKIIEIVQTMIDEFNKNHYALGGKEWREIIASLPSGFCLSASMTTNYRQLKTICIQRKNHLLKEWDEFRKWCLELPEFSDLTGIKE